MKQQSYVRFLAMIVTASVVMYALMYLNTYEWSHVWFSETRLWMAVLMGATMAVVMLLFMWKMYADTGRNMLIIGLGVIAFAGSLWLVRSQSTVGDVSYMKAMIPHHSIAIMTSRRADISDPRVRDLANGIIDAQVREIDEMETLIADIESNGDAPGEPAPVH